MTEKLILQTQALSVSYGRSRAVDCVSLHVPEKSIYGFLGLNGAGKSTAIRAMLGLLRPDNGYVSICGQRVTGRSRGILGKVGSLVESPGFYDHLTGFDNLRIAAIIRDLPETSIHEALELTGLRDSAAKPVGHYSLGMKQRLGLSWALLGEPDLLILDEPINGLDPAGVREVRELLRYLRDERGVTIFLSSHILSEVQQLADRIGVIDHGRLIAEHDQDQPEREELIIRIASDESARAARLVNTLGWSRVVNDSEPGFVTAAVPRKRAAELNAVLNRAGLPVSGFSPNQPDLETYFLQMTGRNQNHVQTAKS